MKAITPDIGTGYEPPSREATNEIKLFGLSDFEVDLSVCLAGRDGEGLVLEIAPTHFIEDVYEVSLGDLLDELLDWYGPSQEALDQMTLMINMELVGLAARMATRIKERQQYGDGK